MLIIRHICQADVNDNLGKRHILSSHVSISDLPLERRDGVVVDVVDRQGPTLGNRDLLAKQERDRCKQVRLAKVVLTQYQREGSY